MENRDGQEKDKTWESGEKFVKLDTWRIISIFRSEESSVGIAVGIIRH